MVWNIKYLVYNNVKWPGPELWCRGGFSVCFVVYGFEILIFCCRLIRLSGLAEWIMVCASAAFWSIEHIYMRASTRPIWGHIWDELSECIHMCQSLQTKEVMSGIQFYRASIIPCKTTHPYASLYSINSWVSAGFNYCCECTMNLRFLPLWKNEAEISRIQVLPYCADSQSGLSCHSWCFIISFQFKASNDSLKPTYQKK